MSISAIIFYLLAALILAMALMAVTGKQLFRSAIWLLCALTGVAGLYFWMEVEFIAAVQIAVYVGGIVVLIIFSIFLTQQGGAVMPGPGKLRKLMAAIAVLSGLLLVGAVLWQAGLQTAPAPLQAEVSQLGEAMLNTGQGGFALPFEVVSLLLLAAMVGAIVIALKQEDNKQHSIEGKVVNQTEMMVDSHQD